MITLKTDYTDFKGIIPNGAILQGISSGSRRDSKKFTTFGTQILLISLALSLFSPKALAQDKVVLKSYYPTPIGVYHNLYVTEKLVVGKDSFDALLINDPRRDFRVYVKGEVLVDSAKAKVVVASDQNFQYYALYIPSGKLPGQEIYGGIHFTDTTQGAVISFSAPTLAPAGVIPFLSFYGAYRQGIPNPTNCNELFSHPHLGNIVFAVQDYRNYGRYPAPYSYGPSYRLKYYRSNECADPDLCNDDPLRSRRNRCHNGYYETGFVTTRRIDGGTHDYYVPLSIDPASGELRYNTLPLPAGQPVWRICVRHADPSGELFSEEGAMPRWNERAVVPGGFQDNLGNPNTPDL